LSYTLDAPGANSQDEQDGYGSRGLTEWEEALKRLARYYQPVDDGMDGDAMVSDVSGVCVYVFCVICICM
jgi:hypothetical protein